MDSDIENDEMEIEVKNLIVATPLIGRQLKEQEKKRTEKLWINRLVDILETEK